ncbi:enoyl-CoA hydratase-related protein [Sphingomonas sp. ID0503]|uniref:enoyl-CoA hydratase-related protein n=1 Tax=Sphingomonas sp. ID0503 TaxID=3399691 RepID=UPI003AFB7A22
MPDLAALLDGSTAPMVTVDREGVRFIILNRPDARNALTRAMRADFAAVLAGADADPGVEGLVLTGAGGTFSAGVDLKDRLPGAPPVEPNPGVALRRLSKPIVAALDGPCVTGAIEMALSCSFAIASPAARFADTHCKVGLFPRWGGGALLTGAIGVRRARQMMLTGAFIDADTALGWGLVNEIVPTDSLLDRAAELARAMADQARRQPLSFGLHDRMLRDIDARNAAIPIEQDLLARYDREKTAAA